MIKMITLNVRGLNFRAMANETTAFAVCVELQESAVKYLGFAPFRREYTWTVR